MKTRSAAAFLAAANLVFAVSGLEKTPPPPLVDSRELNHFHLTCSKNAASTEAVYDFEDFRSGETIKELGGGDVSVEAKRFKRVKRKGRKQQLKITKATAMALVDTDNDSHGVVLIVSEDRDSSDPKGTENGGQFIFKIKRADAIVHALVVAGSQRGDRIKIFRTRRRKTTINVPEARNGAITVPINVADVTRIVVKFKGSAAIPLLKITYCNVQSDDEVAMETAKPTASPVINPSSSTPTSTPMRAPSALPSVAPVEAAKAEPSASPLPAPSTAPSTAAQQPSASPTSTQRAIDRVSDEIKQLIEDTDIFLPAKFIRLSFHDCVGGCDGCVDMDNPSNLGLDIPIDALASIGTDTILTRADIWVLAGMVSAQVTQRSDGDAVSFDMKFVGRPVCKDNNAKGGPDRLMPSAHMTTDELTAYFSDTFGFNDDETVAILGAHTLGGASPQNSGFNGQNGWDLSPETLDKGFYQALDTIPFRESFHMELNVDSDQFFWRHNDRNHNPDIFMLNADMALIVDLTNQMVEASPARGEIKCPMKDLLGASGTACPASGLSETVHEFAIADNNVFVVAFRDVFTKMTNTGCGAGETCLSIV